jgi:hypothetical protein
MLLLGARGWQKQNCGRPAGSCSVVRKTELFRIRGYQGRNRRWCFVGSEGGDVWLITLLPSPARLADRSSESTWK